MARGKRTGGGRPRAGPEEIRFDPRVKAIEQWGDEEAMEAGGEDAFHAGRDKIDIDGFDPIYDDNGLEMDDEVLALKSFARSDDEEDDEDEEVDQGNNASISQQQRRTKSDDYEPVQNKTKLSRYSKKDKNDDESEEESESEEEDTWHPSNYHVRRDAGDAEVDSDDEDAVALDLAETRRIQKSFRSRLDEQDFGLSQEEWDINLSGDDTTASSNSNGAFTADQAGKFESREQEIHHFVQTSPQLLSYANNFVKTCAILPKIDTILESLRNQQNSSNGFTIGSLVVYQETLSKYLESLGRYFDLQFKVNVTIGRDQVDSNEMLLEALERVGQHVGELASLVRKLEKEHSASIDKNVRLFAQVSTSKKRRKNRSRRGEDGEIAAKTVATTIAKTLEVSNKNGKENVLVEEEDEDEEDEEEEQQLVNAKKPRKRSRRKGKGADGELERIKFTNDVKNGDDEDDDDDDDFIESIRLSTSDKADKVNRRKSLQFYTSKIDAKEAKRIGGGNSKERGRIGGDEDIPYRNKEQIRRQILQRQVHNNDSNNTDDQGNGNDGNNGDGDEYYDERNGLERADDVEMDGGDDYYDLVKSAKNARQVVKKETYDQGILDERMQRSTNGKDSHEAGNPRGITRTILKNRGITPKRSKENRNPRVKKRKRFETAKRKVASMHAVYSAEKASAAAGGAYLGEKSGIGKNTVKSRKF